MKIQIINGPNINLLGKREPSIYGSVTFEDYLADLRKRYVDVEIDYFQSNIEGEMIDCIQQVGFDVDGIILNARIMEVDVEDDRNDWDSGYTEVDIIHNGIPKDVLFNQTGNWYSTSWEIRQNELPEAVNNTLNNQYGEYRFDEAEYIEKADGSIYYRIELEKGDVDKVVNIGENGTVLS